MSIAAALAELIRSPDLLDHIAHLERFVAEETRRREQFRADLDENTRTEFINGKVITHADVSPDHQKTTGNAAALLGEFVASRELGKVYSGNCRIGLRRNDYQPDVCFFGTNRNLESSETRKIFPPPDLIVEVLAPATESNDRKLKLQDYAAHGVSEYWIVNADQRMIEQYILPPDEREYALKARLAEGGRLTSKVIEDFTVPVAAFFQ